MVFIPREEAFTCGHCGVHVEPLGAGTYRNHCPMCLWSRHVDEHGPGDRAALCKGMMEPESVDFRSKKGWMIIHHCTVCGKRQPNKCAPDDSLSHFSTAGSQH
ncbi:MAG: hypothetical protein G01um101425_871 [Candidatus Peregrinibacteria bacterium Gr01-1014_25]|nr:MAG: hypothetical protein G01um101425_871 [Candidatus Peregrinibacteria bacterium Gr01-1014_25]